jgi:hypothetical protein
MTDQPAASVPEPAVDQARHGEARPPAGRHRLADEMLVQARACAQLGSPFYAELLAKLAADLRSGGPVAAVLAGWQDAPRDALVPLRLLGAAHALVLSGAAGELAAHYPSVGGDGDADAAWPGLRRLLADRLPGLRAGLDLPPQTNEVARSAALFGGLLWLLARVSPAAGPGRPPVRLVELGASGGLNLRADHFRYTGAGVAWGPADSPVRLADCWQGAPPPPGPVRVVERRGCDLAPIDAAAPAGQLRLASYVWPDQVDRLARLRAACQVARRVPVDLVRAGAAEFLREVQPAAGTLTVVWHSIMWQYLDEAEVAAADEQWARLAAVATDRAPVARLSVELDPVASPPLAVVRGWLWPRREELVLGEASPHGLPVRWRVRSA